jgi:uncharacterized protein
MNAVSQTERQAERHAPERFTHEAHGETRDERGRAIDPHSTSDERTYAVMTHLVGLLAFLDLGLFISPVATLVMWQVKKGESHWLDDHLKEAMNFQISLLIWSLIAVVVSVLTLGIGAVVMVPFLIALRLVGCIRGAIWANKGRYHRYPASWRFIH